MKFSSDDGVKIGSLGLDSDVGKDDAASNLADAQINYTADNISISSAVEKANLEAAKSAPFSAFKAFLRSVEQMDLTEAVTASGTRIISQSERNTLRQQGLKALEEDLKRVFSPSFDVVRTKDGFVIVAEGRDFTFSWELKSTIKSLDYDPFIEAENYYTAVKEKSAKRQAAEAAKKAREEAIKARREAKVAEIEARRGK